MQKTKIALLLFLHIFIVNSNALNNISIVGTGYVGLVTGAGLADIGNQVICADVDQRKIALLHNGQIPIYEPGLKEVVDRNVAQKRLTFTDNVADAVQQSDVIFIAVGTPMADTGAADLSYVHGVVQTIARNINGFKIICTKSTVPVGTGAWIRKTLEDAGVPSSQFSIVSNPEFLREGTAVQDFLSPDRIVLGTEDQSTQQVMEAIYRKLFEQGAKKVFTNVTTSEMIKYASNAFLAVKLSYINEIANLCDATGADVQTVAFAMGLDKRISPLFLNPGPGFGGSCFPKDSQALLFLADNKQVKLPVVHASLETNEIQKKIPAQKLLKLLNNDVRGKTIGILGLAFKADTDDVRCSPAIQTIKLLIAHGARIKAYDPAGMDNMKLILPNITYCSCAEEVFQAADGLIIMTEWDEFKNLAIATVAQTMNNKVLVDARNIINIAALQQHGFTFDCIGKGIQK